MLGINGCPELTFWCCIASALSQVGIEAHLFHGRCGGQRKRVRGAPGTHRNGVESEQNSFRGKDMTSLKSFQRLECLPFSCFFEARGRLFLACQWVAGFWWWEDCDDFPRSDSETRAEERE